MTGNQLYLPGGHMAHKEIDLTDVEKIKKYMEDINGPLHHEGSVVNFIESHRYLRSLNLENREIRQEAFRQGYESGRSAGMESITNGLYIAVDKLKAMTVLELAQFLAEE